ncbi:MAG: slipin family protein [Chitinophaga sp.]|uniref:slipin family protein n=1 Tax=Chitinophaga sp. TaxID=1869181 RepID=UPI0025B7F845|nr:slipin family protein [Chitinophaga sp.]MBV8251960.1 slipin family protein [Chitinophaga sp.]
MKRIVVARHQVGLVLRNGDYKRTVGPGTYWFFSNENVVIYDVNQTFVAPAKIPVATLLEDPDFLARVQVLKVKENEVAIMLEDDVILGALSAGIHVFWKSLRNLQFIRQDISSSEMIRHLGRDILHHKALAHLFCTYMVDHHEKAVLLVDGQFEAVLSGGVYTFWNNNSIIEIRKVDMRMKHLEISGQEMLTSDKATLRMNAQAWYKVTEIDKALLLNREAEKQLYVQVQMGLREYIGTLTFDELLEKKGDIGRFVLEQSAAGAAALGIQLLGFGVKDIILPGDVKEIMNQVLVAEKKAQAQIIMRREETASTRSLLNTARLMEENPMLYKLKEMEYVERIAEKVGHISIGNGSAFPEQMKQLFAVK